MKGNFTMKKTRIFASIAAASAAAMTMTAVASAYDLGDKYLGLSWGTNVTIPASEFADLTADSYVTVTYTPNLDDDGEKEEYWSIKPMDSSWTFIDPNGEGGPELAEGKDAYPVESDSSSITFKVPADMVDSIKEGGMIIIGHKVTLHELTISDKAPDTTPSGGNENNTDTNPPTGDTGTNENPKTGIEGVAIAAGAALLAAAAVAVCKKK